MSLEPLGFSIKKCLIRISRGIVKLTKHMVK